MRYIMFSTGNIPVDRKSKDRQTLFKGTIDALSSGSAVALFPEGTSYTEPRIMQVKDGAAWAALEFTKWLKQNPGTTQQDVTIVPVSIVYTNKTKYRSEVRFLPIYHFTKKIIYDSRLSWSMTCKHFLSIYFAHTTARFGHPITMDSYKQQFFSSIDGEARAAVKRLTRTIENELVETSINAPDW